MKKMLLAFSAIVMLATTSCKKDKDEEPANITPTKDNLVGTYKITAVTFANINVFDNSDQTKNIYQACDRDDQYKLNADLNYQIIDAGTVCSPDNNDSGTWSLSGTILNLDGEMGTITSYNGKKLVITEASLGASLVITYEKL